MQVYYGDYIIDDVMLSNSKKVNRTLEICEPHWYIYMSEGEKRSVSGSIRTLQENGNH